MIVAGIDEAGLGPVLGPLVMTSSAFGVPDEGGQWDLWEVLQRAVCRDLRGVRKGRLAYADSKNLYHRGRSDALAELERSVLCMVLAGREEAALPDSLGALLDVLAGGARAEAGGYPWYGTCGLELPRCGSAEGLELSANVLRVAMRQAGVRLLGLRARPIFVERYNRTVAATDNKATTAFDVTCGLLAELWSSWPEEGVLRVTVDRQGGRQRYVEPLRRVFASASLKVVEETDRRSVYRLSRDGRVMEVRFCVDGEKECLSTALGSMASKYLRELFMELLNAYWAQHVPGLKPTAGYYQDGRRFLREIEAAARKLNTPMDCLVRER